MMNFPKGTTVDKTNLQPVELIHMDFAFYILTSVQVFASILAVLFVKTIMLWFFPISSKRSPLRII